MSFELCAPPSGIYDGAIQGHPEDYLREYTEHVTYWVTKEMEYREVVEAQKKPGRDARGAWAPDNQPGEEPESLLHIAQTLRSEIDGVLLLYVPKEGDETPGTPEQHLKRLVGCLSVSLFTMLLTEKNGRTLFTQLPYERLIPEFPSIDNFIIPPFVHIRADQNEPPIPLEGIWRYAEDYNLYTFSQPNPAAGKGREQDFIVRPFLGPNRPSPSLLDFQQVDNRIQ